MSHAVIFGAGNIGRGFIGQLCAAGGLPLVLVDIDAPLLARLNQVGEYTIELVDNQGVRAVRVGPVRGVDGRDREAVAEAVAGATIGATAVGARALEAVAPMIALGLERRQARQAGPLNFLICENLKDAAAHARGLVTRHLPPATLAWAGTQVGFVDTVIGRMVPQPDAALRARDLSLIRAEPYAELPVDASGIRGVLPTVPGLVAADQFARYTARKLYIHNCGHALLAYLGRLRGHTLCWEALADPVVLAALRAGWAESRAGIVHATGAAPAWLQAHCDELEERFANRPLGDPLDRLGRDPIRKLAPSDRLVAPARLALAAGVTPRALASGIAAALRFAPADDPLALELQAKLRADSLPKVLQTVAGIAPDEPLGRLVQDADRQLDAWAAGKVQL